MASSLDMSLDDLIKNNKQQNSQFGRGRGRGARTGRFGGGGRGGRRIQRQQQQLRVNTNARPSPYSIAKSFSRAKDAIWQHDMFDDSMVAIGADSGAKLYISNLDYGVSNQDIKELFSEVGDLRSSAVHYDRSGRSIGTAEVVFLRRNDAIAAMKRYNNVQLDGKPMKIELVGTSLGFPVADRLKFSGAPAGRGRTVSTTPGFQRAVVDASSDQRG
eukprot:TRINITY_DN3498_c0_g1_i2.p1 TRINITY_DN3498_c0_g1~~TRINITY_DN3498_c0_g1_i2.p1  ORF type:complete len:216 (+),score=21.85 TRINITY_DN3498_c0_g1_i2:360-1007(+)